jgi:hypothetical protein
MQCRAIKSFKETSTGNNRARLFCQLHGEAFVLWWTEWGYEEVLEQWVEQAEIWSAKTYHYAFVIMKFESWE